MTANERKQLEEAIDELRSFNRYAAIKRIQSILDASPEPEKVTYQVGHARQHLCQFDAQGDYQKNYKLPILFDISGCHQLTQEQYSSLT